MTPFIFIISLGILGAILGSFTTMLIHRLHYEEPGILTGRSKCPKCKKTLKIQNLIPIFSWIFQGGKCANCHKKIPGTYPLIELIFVITFILFGQKWGLTIELIPVIMAVFGLLILFFYDVLFLEVDDRVVAPFIVLALIWSYFSEVGILDALIGGVVGFSFYALQYFPSKGRWVGAGDLRLGALMGVLLGWQFLLLALFLAYIIGSFVAIYFVIFKKYTKNSQLPMGAFLMPATIFFLYDGKFLWDWYMGTILGF